ncbi:MAG: PIG-L family deacetylase [Chloroflexi bacterium]|nr:PIG-L family deacetylase [Chloroflexota bacterium]
MAEHNRTIMVVGGHAADAEVMAGATILKHVKAGYRAVLVHMTLGEKGHRSMPVAEYAEQKRREAETAAKALAADVVCMPYPDGELAVNEETQWKIADVMREYRPDVVITHWHGSIHRDHRNTSINVTEALYFAGLPAFRREWPAWRPKAVYFAENWEDPYGFQPEISLDVTDVFPAYLEAIKSYELVRGGISSFPYFKYYEALGTIRGALAGYDKGVALMRPEGARMSRQELLI